MTSDKEGVLSTGSPTIPDQHASESSRQGGSDPSESKAAPPPRRAQLILDPDAVMSQLELPAQVQFRRR